ncbi:hypothetical protein [Bradyrhizobium sp. NAS80.1]|nr:hypothetical protein [Bradyrhizobium sp. NAS80.1]
MKITQQLVHEAAAISARWHFAVGAARVSAGLRRALEMALSQ